MKRRNSSILLFGFVFAYSLSFGQMGQYKYKRALPAAQDQWNKIILPDALFGKLNADLSDLRIYGITKNYDTLTAPYLMQEASAKVSGKELVAALINQSANAKGHYFTFETGTANTVNRMLLDFKQENFDWRVQLEGSQDQKEWFTLIDNYRILSIRNDLTDFKFTSLVFPDAKYQYYRLLVNNKETPVLRSAKIAWQQVTAGIEKKFALSATRVQQDKQARQTIINVQLAMPVPVSKVKIYVHDTVDYYRPVTLQYARDSIQITGGWSYHFETMASATLNSIEQNELTGNSAVTDKLQLVISNQDNQPLKIDSVEVKGYEHALIVRLAEPAAYWLVYGNDKAKAPDYDISRFTGKIPAALTTLSLGEEVLMENDKAAVTTPLFQNKIWLWALMILIIATLGGFSISMMKKAGNK